MSEDVINTIARYVPEVVLVVIFMAFILRRDRDDHNEMKGRDQMWLTFLREQREQTGVVISRLAEEIKSNTTQLSSVVTILTAHDMRAQQGIAELVGRRKKREAQNED